MTQHSTEISVTACHSALADLFAGLAVACAQLSVSDGDSLRLQLLAEELFINTVDHGFSGKTGAPVHLRLARDERGLTLHYEDVAPAFDPRQPPPPRDESTIGGLGLPMLQGMSREISYRRDGNRNIIDLLLQETAD